MTIAREKMKKNEKKVGQRFDRRQDVTHTSPFLAQYLELKKEDRTW